MSAITALEKYIDSISWTSSACACFTESPDEYIRRFEKLLGKKHINGNPLINYEDDLWDFRPYYESTDEKIVIRFRYVPKEILEIIKCYALYKLVNGIKVSTVNGHIYRFSHAINSILDSKQYNSFALITTNDIIEHIESKNYSAGTKSNAYISIIDIADFINYNYRYPLLIDIYKLKSNAETATNNRSTTLEETKIPNMPDKLYTLIRDKAVETMRSEHEPYEYRATACMIVILSQTGLRINDLTRIKTDAIEETTLSKSGYKCHFLKYTAQKPTKAFEKMKEFKIFATSLTVEAFNTLLEIRNQCRFSKEPYLYVIEPYRKKFDKFPVSGKHFYKQYLHFLYNYLYDVINQPWDNIRQIVFNPNTKKAETLSCPDTRQFRVYVCTDLYNKGVSLLYIRTYMGHLESQMEGYYVRPKDVFQENTAYAGKVIKDIYEGTKPLGLYSSEISEAVTKFINENNLNVYTDIDEVVKAFGDRITIRAKDGGACITCNMFGCSKDNRTNEAMCAYNLCPNIYHFFYSIDMTYQNFKNLQDTFQANLNNHFEKAAQKELSKIKDLINRRLDIEIIELEKEIEKRGIDNVLDQYPTLIDVVSNLNNIREEIEVWRTKKI